MIKDFKIGDNDKLLVQYLKGKYIWETFQNCETTLRIYSLRWEDPKSGQTQDQVLRHIRKVLYMKDVLRRAKGRFVEQATKKMKKNEFAPSLHILLL